MWDEFALIIGACLLGSFPFIYLMGRVQGIDLRKYDDMHLGLWQNVGRIQGFIGAGFDFAKGVIVVLSARAAGFDTGWVAFAGVAAVAGQMWPIFMKFKGEKGNTTGLAMAGTLATTAMLIGLIPFAIGFGIRTIPRFIKKEQSMDDRFKFGGPPSLSLPLGVAIGFAVFPLAAWLTGQPSEVVVAFTGLFVMIIIRRVHAGVGEMWQQSPGRARMILNLALFDRPRL